MYDIQKLGLLRSSNLRTQYNQHNRWCEKKGRLNSIFFLHKVVCQPVKTAYVKVRHAITIIASTKHI